MNHTPHATLLQVLRVVELYIGSSCLAESATPDRPSHVATCVVTVEVNSTYLSYGHSAKQTEKFVTAYIILQ